MELKVKSIVHNDLKTNHEIQERYILITNFMCMAEAKELKKEFIDAYELYFKAQELSFPAGEGAVLKIKPDHTDECNWHMINERLLKLDEILFH
jgi:hypothetical protein